MSATIGELQEASKTVCVMGSGRCGTHNVKLIKSVKSKKMSCLEPGGNIGWKYVDVTCLVCPSKTSELSESGLAKNQSGGVGGAKKKGKVLKRMKMNTDNQSEGSLQSGVSTSRS